MISTDPQRRVSRFFKSNMPRTCLRLVVSLFLILAYFRGKYAIASPGEAALDRPSEQNISGSDISWEQRDSSGTGAHFQSTLFYRASGLAPRKDSVYHKNEHSDFADQIYATLRFTHMTDHIPDIVIEPAFRTIRNNPGKWDDLVIHQAYMESRLTKNWTFTTGKKVEYRGSGFLVNPSDLLNEHKDLFDPLYQQEGVVFSRVSLQLGDSKIGLGVIPLRGQSMKKGKGWFTLDTIVWDAEVLGQMTIQESDKISSGLSVQRFLGDYFEMHFDGRYQARQRSVAEFDWVKYSDYAGDRLDTQSDDHSSFYSVIGSRFVLTPRRSFTAEYINNQSGLTPGNFARRFEDFAEETRDSGKVREPPTQYTGRRYGFLAIQDGDLLPSTHLSASIVANIDDRSTYLSLTAKRPLSKTIHLELTPMFFKGGSRSEFGEMPFGTVFYLTLRGKI